LQESARQDSHRGRGDQDAAITLQRLCSRDGLLPLYLFACRGVVGAKFDMYH